MKKYIYILAPLTILALAGLVYVLFFASEASAPQENNNQVNVVDLEPPTDEVIKEVEDAKQSGDIGADQPTLTDASIEISITGASLNGDTTTVRAQVIGSATGVCTFIVTDGVSQLQQSQELVEGGGSAGCVVKIDTSSLDRSATWEIEGFVNDGDRQSPSVNYTLEASQR